VSDQLTLVKSPEADVSLVDLRAFDDVSALFERRHSLEGPALIRVSADVGGETLTARERRRRLHLRRTGGPRRPPSGLNGPLHARFSVPSS
jgi:hypothetical protein